jgi:hypothetical protein
MNASFPSAQSVAKPSASAPHVPVLSEVAWRYDHAWRILNLNQELIRSTDQKTYMLIVMSTLLVSFAASNLDRLSHRDWVNNAALPLLALATVAFFVFALATLLARHKAVAGEFEGASSLVFFGDIARRESVSSYLDDFHATLQPAAVDDLLTQTAIVDAILRTKLANYQRAWWVLATQVVIFVAINVLGHMG